MSKIIYSKRLTTDGACKKFFSIPVKPIKIMMRYSDKPQINHFERAILTLLLHDFYTISELSNMLEISMELVELIENNLREKGFINEKSKVMQPGVEAINGVYSDVVDKVCYVFYDLNRELLLKEFCKGSDIVITEGNRNSFILESDAFSEEVPFRPIRTRDEKAYVKSDMIENSVKRDVFISGEKNLISVKVLEIDASTYELISYVETDDKTKETKWTVKNPITLEQDIALCDYFYRHSDNKDISKIIMNIMEFRRNSCVISEADKKTYEVIKTRLFNKKVEGLHEEFIIPLISVINVLGKEDTGNYDEKIARINTIKKAMTEMGDLFEKITWQAAMESSIESQMYYEKVLKGNKDNNLVLLEEAAKNIGFDISEDSKKLLLTDVKTIGRCIKKPECVQLSECISWGLTIAMVEKDFYLWHIAKTHPNFISLLYRFKRDYRDRNKHTTMVELISPKIYFDLLWDLLDAGFGFKVNEEVLNELISESSNIYDFSFTYEKLRTTMGNALFESSNEMITRIKLSLIEMYEAYLTKRCSYLSEAYKLVDETMLILDQELKNRYCCSYKALPVLFATKEQIVDFLGDCGFNTNTHSEVGNDLAGALDFFTVSQNVEKGFLNDFNNAVLRVKVLALVDMLHEKQECLEVFSNYKDLFISTSTLSYLQGHQQKHEFDESIAGLVVEDVMAMVGFLLNDVLVIK